MAQNTQNYQTYEELMKGIAICYTDEAFKALTEGKDKSYIGCDIQRMMTGNHAKRAYKLASCIEPDAETLLGRFFSDSAPDACMLLLALRGKEQHANLMRVVQHGPENDDGSRFLASVEYWYISGE